MARSRFAGDGEHYFEFKDQGTLPSADQCRDKISTNFSAIAHLRTPRIPYRGINSSYPWEYITFNAYYSDRHRDMSGLVDPRYNTPSNFAFCSGKGTLLQSAHVAISAYVSFAQSAIAKSDESALWDESPRVKFVIARNYPFDRAVRYTEL